MKRRDVLRWTGVAGVLAVAGCVASNDGTGGDGTDGDDTDDGADGGGSTPASESTRTPEPDSSDEGSTGSESGEGNAGSDEGDTDSDGHDVLAGYDDSDPVAAVESYLAAWREGDVDAANALLYEDGEMEPVPDEEQDDAAEDVPTVVEVANVEEDGETATVEVVLAMEDAERSFTFDLRAVDGAWRIAALGLTAREHAPEARFALDFDDGTATIVHEGGDAVPADELYVRGEGIGATGVWHELSEELGPDDEVQAGDRVAVDVGNEYTVTLVWDDGEHSVSLHSASGASESESVEASPVDRYLAETENYDGTVQDFTGQDEVTVAVGSADEPQFVFDPPAVRVDQGTTVVWEWSGEAGAHDVVAEDDAFESAIHSEEGVTFGHTFEESGTYLYYCEPHRSLGMKGAVVVEG